MKKHLFTKIYEYLVRKVRICGIWTWIAPSLHIPSSARLKLHSRLVCSRTQGYLSTQVPAGGLKQLLIKLRSWWVQLEGGDSLVPPRYHSRKGRSTLVMVPLRILRHQSHFPWLVRWCFHIRRKTGKPQVTALHSTEGSTPSVGLSLREACHYPHSQLQGLGSEILPGSEGEAGQR